MSSLQIPGYRTIVPNEAYVSRETVNVQLFRSEKVSPAVHILRVTLYNPSKRDIIFELERRAKALCAKLDGTKPEMFVRNCFEPRDGFENTVVSTAQFKDLVDLARGMYSPHLSEVFQHTGECYLLSVRHARLPAHVQIKSKTGLFKGSIAEYFENNGFEEMDSLIAMFAEKKFPTTLVQGTLFLTDQGKLLPADKMKTRICSNLPESPKALKTAATAVLDSFFDAIGRAETKDWRTDLPVNQKPSHIQLEYPCIRLAEYWTSLIKGRQK